MVKNGQLKEEYKYWKELEKILGWRLSGWTYKHRAQFVTHNYHSGLDDTIQITGSQRDDIVIAYYQRNG